jgi:hypothetical protein
MLYKAPEKGWQRPAVEGLLRVLGVPRDTDAVAIKSAYRSSP